MLITILTVGEGHTEHISFYFATDSSSGMLSGSLLTEGADGVDDSGLDLLFDVS